MAIRVLVNGAFGRMGLVTQQAIASADGLTLAATTSRNDDLATSIKQSQADVVVDFTLPDAVYNNTCTIIEMGARPVIGTSGLTLPEIQQLANLCEKKQLGGIIAPNFSIGAILMMRYAQDAVKYLPHVEIIEMHHEKKLNAPSGTAVKTAQMIADARNSKTSTIPHEAPARGLAYQDIPIHSVRLPGFFAHQMVIFGGNGETLTIRHDSNDRSSIMPGVCLACHQVMQLNHLVYGLDKLL